MSKKHTLSKEAQVLLKLLRLALGTEPLMYFGDTVEPFPDNIDWNEVIRLSYKHKVSALAADGLKSCAYNPYNGLNESQALELKAIIETWINDRINIENSYNYYNEVVKTICQVFAANGLKPVILKGIGLAENYSIPSHRGAGDLDIYILDPNNNPVPEKGDEILINQLGLTSLHPEESEQHHSQFDFKGIHIENHYELVSTYFNNDKDIQLRQNLQSLLHPLQKNDNIYFPNPTFNAIYLIQHLYAHFYFGMVNLRQFTDLITFLRNHHQDVDWNKFIHVCSSSNLLQFAKGINGILDKYFSLNSTSYIPLNIDDNLGYLLMNDAFLFGAEPTNGICNIDMYYKDRWHYHYFGNYNWFKLTFNHIYRKLIKIGK